MRLFISLLFISATNLILCASVDVVKFRIEILEPDLEPIAKYYKRDDANLDSFIHWPHDIVFHIEKEDFESKDYLKINGLFQTKKLTTVLNSYDGFYYRNGKFFIKQEGTMSDFARDTLVYCEPTAVSKGNSYLAIRYHSPEEVEKAIQPFSSQNGEFMKTASKPVASTYLATWGEPAQYLLEYSTLKGNQPALPEGGLRILVGKIEDNKLSVARNRNAVKVVFDSATGKASLPVHADSVSPPLFQNVLAVRMDTKAFLAEVRDGKVKILSDDDLVLSTKHHDDLPLDKDTSRHRVSATNFVAKTSKVEPRRCPVTDSACKQSRPKVAKYQISGHVLIKKANHLDDGVTLNGNCPFAIESENGADFSFGNERAKQLCTDDEKVWGGSYTKDNTFKKWDVITLLYP